MRISRTSTEIGWVSAQTVGFLALLAAPWVSRVSVPRAVRLAGACLTIVSGAWTVFAYRSLGRSHSPWVTPTPDVPLATSGAYGVIRHPIYAGWTGLALGWGLMTGSPMALALSMGIGVFYDSRSRAEERALSAVHPRYEGYQRKVRRFIPRVY